MGIPADFGNSFLSLQGQPAAYRLPGTTMPACRCWAATLASQLVFTAQASGPYTVVQHEQSASPLSYTLTIPNPDADGDAYHGPYSAPRR